GPSDPATGTATGLPPGTYTLLIEEVGVLSTQCTVTENFFISEPTPIGINLVNNINANCNIGAQVTVDGTGATPPYEYAFVVDGAAATGYTSSATAELDPAVSLEWDIYVRDAKGCEITIPVDVTIIEVPSPVIALSVVDNCVTEGNFQVLVERTPAAPTDSPAPFTISVNGSAPQAIAFTFNAITGFDEYTISGLNSGAYTVEVFDANGCSSGSQP